MANKTVWWMNSSDGWAFWYLYVVQPKLLYWGDHMLQNLILNHLHFETRRGEKNNCSKLLLVFPALYPSSNYVCMSLVCNRYRYTCFNAKLLFMDFFSHELYLIEDLFFWYNQGSNRFFEYHNRRLRLKKQCRTNLETFVVKTLNFQKNSLGLAAGEHSIILWELYMVEG